MLRRIASVLGASGAVTPPPADRGRPVARGRARSFARSAPALSAALGVALALRAVAAQPSESAPPQTPDGRAVAPEAAPPAEPPAPRPRPPIKLVRYDEDWRALRDPAVPREPLDPIKDIWLSDSGELSLSIGGTARIRYERFDSTNFGAGPQDRDGFLLQRYLLHADARLGDSLRAFVELKSIREDGRTGGPRPLDENLADLHQAFADVALPLGDLRLTLRPGRQELNFGSSRLITARDGPNDRLAFDAFRATLAGKGWRLDGLVAAPVETDRGVFDDQHQDDVTLWAAYATIDRPVLPGAGGVDIYYIGYDESQARYAQGAADETRHSLGVRLFGRSGALDYNWEAVGQFGSFGNDDILAWTLGTDTGLTLAGAWSPRLGLKVNFISGDDDPGDGRLGSFNAMFPRGSYFGEISVVGPRNLINIEPSISISPHPTLTLSTSLNAFWRYAEDDGLYNPGGTLIRPPGGSNDRFIGLQPGVSVAWRPQSYLTLRAEWAYFFPGGFIEDTGPNEDINFIQLTAQFRF